MPREWFRRLNWLLLAAVLAFSVWRARQQGFTIDEAFVYNTFVSQKLSRMAEHYDACNHVLHTLLMKASRQLLGASELALRLPSLLGALLCCLATRRLAEFLMNGWGSTLLMAVILLNPMMLDFFVAARGYGLAVGLLLWALYWALRWLTTGQDDRWLRRAGILAGLSIAANLTMLIPCAALGLMLLVLASRDGRPGLWRVIERYGIVSVVVAFLFLALPLLRASADHFYFGIADPLRSVTSILGSIVKNQARWPGFIEPAYYGAAAALIAAGLLAGLLRRAPASFRETPRPFRTDAWVLLAGTTLLMAAAVTAQVKLAGSPWPLGRTGIAFIPMISLSVGFGLRLQPSRMIRRAGSLAGLAVLLMCVVQLDGRYFAEWRYDAGTKRLMRRLEADYRQREWKAPRKVLLGTQVHVKQTAFYYWQRRMTNWMERPESDDLETKKYDYYLLTEEQENLAPKLGLEVIEVDKLSRQILARSRS